jgi:ABC-type antimicrobial peptide transport system permease subunit
MHVQPRTILVTAILAGVATIVSSLLPALRSARSVGVDDLRQGARLTSDAKRQRLRTLLATVQIALAASLLTAAGLTIGAVDRAANDSLGFSPAQVLTARLSLPHARYTSGAQREAFVRTVLDRLRTLPSVNVAAALTVLPYSNTNASSSFWLDTDTPRDNNARYVDVRSALPTGTPFSVCQCCKGVY